MSIEELIAKLETAESGNYALDCAIFAHVRDAWRDHPRHEIISVLLFTTSIDAALTLLPEGFAVCDFVIWPGARSTLTVMGTHKGRDGIYWHQGEDGRFLADGATPALALCIAALRARAGLRQ